MASIELKTLGLHTHKYKPLPEDGSRIEIEMVQGEKPSSLSFSCSICLEDCPNNKFLNVTETCDHSFCENCLKEYLKEQISNFKVNRILCPQEGCKSIFLDKYLRQLLDVKEYKAYETLLINKVTLSDPKKRFCPMAGCTSQLPYSAKSPKIKCKCGTIVCSTCGKAWHEGKTCLESIDIEFELYSSEHEIKFCSICKTTIKKMEGCDHITCPICDYEWCWKCGRQYSNTHEPTCPKTWDPCPPQKPISWKDYWIERSFQTKLIICLILVPFIPVILPLSLSLYSDYIYSYTDRNKTYLPPLKAQFNQSSRCTKICLSMLLVLFSPFILVITLSSWNFYGYFCDNRAICKIVDWKKRLSESSLFKATFLAIGFILCYPIILSGLYLFWPLYEFSWGSKLSKQKILKSLAILGASFLIGAVCLPLTLINVFGLPPLISLLKLTRYAYHRLKAFLRNERRPQLAPAQIVNKRWMTSDPSKFTYTSQGRPRVGNNVQIALNIPEIPNMRLIELPVEDAPPQ